MSNWSAAGRRVHVQLAGGRPEDYVAVPPHVQPALEHMLASDLPVGAGGAVGAALVRPAGQLDFHPTAQGWDGQRLWKRHKGCAANRSGL